MDTKIHKLLTCDRMHHLKARLQLVPFYNAGKKSHLLSKHSKKFKQELNLQDQTNETVTCTLQVKQIKMKAKRETQADKINLGKYTSA